MQQLKPSTSYNNYKDFPDLYIVSVGREGENPKHSFGPVVFHSYAFQYLVYGQGKYTVDGKTYDIRRGDMMLIPKDCVVKYEADPENPYSYFWVCFDGDMADKLLDLTALSLNTPVVSYNNDSLAFSMDNIVKNVHLNNMPASVAATGELYKLFSLLAKKCTACEQSTNNVRSEYILESMLYMHENFARAITIDEVARHVGLNRTYFSTQFKKQVTATPIDYLNAYRIGEAVKMLKETNLSISEIGKRTGFENPVSFYLGFKKRIGCSPKEYRASLDDMEKYLSESEEAIRRQENLITVNGKPRKPIRVASVPTKEELAVKAAAEEERSEQLRKGIGQETQSDEKA